MAETVTVVVLNWNGLGVIAECLDSLMAQTDPETGLIVLDNGSTDGSVEYLRRRGGFRLIESPINRGFAAGVNQAILACRSPYIALLNNDAVADKHWIAAMRRVMLFEPQCGMVAPLILAVGDAGMIDSTGLVVSRDGIGRGRWRGQREGRWLARIPDPLMPSGCAALYRRRLFEDIGLFDEDFFAYGEDTDLGLRARWAGWTCRFAPEALVWHRYSASTGAVSSFKALQTERNRIWVLVKNAPMRELLMSPPWTLLRYAWHAWAALRGQGQTGAFTQGQSAGSLLRLLLRAWVEAMRGVPRMWRKRQGIERRISVRTFRRLLRTHRISLRDIARGA